MSRRMQRANPMLRGGFGNLPSCHSLFFVLREATSPLTENYQEIRNSDPSDPFRRLPAGVCAYLWEDDHLPRAHTRGCCHSYRFRRTASRLSRSITPLRGSEFVAYRWGRAVPFGTRGPHGYTRRQEPVGLWRSRREFGCARTYFCRFAGSSSFYGPRSGG